MNKIRSSLRRLASLRTLVTVACLTGLQVALKLVISIQVTQTVRISLDYLVHVAVSAMFGPEMDWLEPGIRNSNLLPVNATGDVRLRSVVSCGMAGSTSTPMRSLPFLRSV